MWLHSRDVEFAVSLLTNASSHGLCPDISTYKVMIPAVAKVGRIAEAFRLFYAALEDDHRPFQSLFAAIIKALCKAGRFADAFAFFGDMESKGHPPNRPVYVMLVKMCVRGGRFVEAANYLVEMSEAGFAPLLLFHLGPCKSLGNATGLLGSQVELGEDSMLPSEVLVDASTGPPLPLPLRWLMLYIFYDNYNICYM
ncbi:hypothetical protein E2562_006927 [Oryza meyeriana var. granulata]|uniref:Pentacotripeptide-repeat region of PRORP domain-containing protein n=1 Tax=Oryza meyeriana var. granulata TaxID=110450 RepID=A0A6G1BJP7_9ORYZ|nr:hypothetical protein E2562_006927 [Oryza meyeriana var. granulata]